MPRDRAAVLLLVTFTACTAGYRGADAGGGTDAAIVTDAGPDAARSNVGLSCTSQETCGGDLECRQIEGNANGLCTKDCSNATTQPAEQSQCGGTGTTCLTAAAESDAESSSCARSCSPRVANTGCAANEACTGFWWTQSDYTADTAGCTQFCHTDAQCAAGRHCSRFGTCETWSVNMSLRGDGQPCDPSLDPAEGASTQCRGLCGQETANTHQGICFSIIDHKVTTTCADDDRLVPLGDNTDNLWLCNYLACTCEGECPSGLHCADDGSGSGSGMCRYLDSGEDAITCDGDGGTGSDAQSSGG